MTADPSPGDIRHESGLLYLCSGRAEFPRQMPCSDEWGLRPADLVGPRENPVVVASPPVTRVDLASGDGAGRQASPEAGGSGVETPMSRGALEASSSGACETCPEVVVDEGTQPAAPEAKTPEASGGHQEAGPGHSSQPGAPEAGRLGASSSMPRAGPHVESLGWFRIDFDALRKRKESSSGSNRPAVR